jgi:hypothetical protein
MSRNKTINRVNLIAKLDKFKKLRDSKRNVIVRSPLWLPPTTGRESLDNKMSAFPRGVDLPHVFPRTAVSRITPEEMFGVFPAVNVDLEWNFRLIDDCLNNLCFTIGQIAAFAEKYANLVRSGYSTYALLKAEGKMFAVEMRIYRGDDIHLSIYSKMSNIELCPDESRIVVPIRV